MRNARVVRVAVGILMLVSPVWSAGASAAGITVICSNGIKAVMEELVPRFEEATTHKVVIRYGLSAALKQQIDAGAPFDLAVLTPALLDDLIKQGKVAARTRVVLARSPIAIAIRAGTPKPDIATTEALTRTLLASTSIAFAREGAGGLLFAELIKRLALTEALQPKFKPKTTGDEVSAAVARGEAQLGVMPLSEILPAPGVEVLGTFPAGVGGYVLMVAGGSSSTQGNAAAALTAFVMTPDALPVLKKHGMERNP
jgi:molybdate transport system substrate-binding protein